MSDTNLELTDGFVRNVLEDNARLRRDLDAAVVRGNELDAALKEARRKRLRELWRVVRAAGGKVETHPQTEPDPRGLYIEENDFEFDSTVYYLADPAAQPVRAESLYSPDGHANGRT